MKKHEAFPGQTVTVTAPDGNYSALMTPYVGRTLTIDHIDFYSKTMDMPIFTKELPDIPFDASWLYNPETFSAENENVKASPTGRLGRFAIHDEVEFQFVPRGKLTRFWGRPGKGSVTALDSIFKREFESEFAKPKGMFNFMIQSGPSTIAPGDIKKKFKYDVDYASIEKRIAAAYAIICEGVEPVKVKSDIIGTCKVCHLGCAKGWEDHCSSCLIASRKSGTETGIQSTKTLSQLMTAKNDGTITQSERIELGYLQEKTRQQAFVPKPDRVLVEPSHSQVEIRVAAQMATKFYTDPGVSIGVDLPKYKEVTEAELTEAYDRANKTLHTTPVTRNPLAKNINFGIQGPLTAKHITPLFETPKVETKKNDDDCGCTGFQLLHTGHVCTKFGRKS